MKLFIYKPILFISLLVLTTGQALAFPPQAFNALYQVKLLTGLKAEADLKLEKQDDGSFQFNAEARLFVLGKQVTTATADGKFTENNDSITPHDYEFIQTGWGKKSRSIFYNWENNQAETIVEGNREVLAIEDSFHDELSMYMELQQQVAKGEKDIMLNIIDENEIKTYHYQYAGKEQLELDSGLFNAVKYIKIIDAGKKHKAELWFASDWNYLILKLAQKTSIRTVNIDLHEAHIEDSPVTPLKIQ